MKAIFGLLLVAALVVAGTLYFINAEGLYDVEGSLRSWAALVPGSEKVIPRKSMLPQKEAAELQAVQVERMQKNSWELLKKAREKLVGDEAAINTERQRLSQWESELERREKAIKDREVEFSNREKTYERAVKYYITMKPVDAARILSQQEDILVIEIFRRMNERNVAAILAEMDPAVAGAIMRKMSR